MANFIKIETPGIKAEGTLLHHFRKEVADLLHRSGLGFAGAQPVSFSRRHLEELRQRDYYVCEKSDGTRYLLYLTEDEAGNETHYLIDRKNNYWWVNKGNLHFSRNGDDQAFHTRTLIDGELVEEDLGNGKKEIKYLVFDCLVLDGGNLMSRTLDKRLAYFQEAVLKPYKDLFKRFPEELPFQPFIVEMKDMQFAYGIEMMFRQILPRLRHGNDGLIFTCRNSEYKHGTDPHIVKWKPSWENSVDFRWKLHFPIVEPDEYDVAEGYTEPYTDWDAKPSASLLVYMGDRSGGSKGGGEGGEPGSAGAGAGAGPGPAGLLSDTRYETYGELWLEDDEWDTLKKHSVESGDPLDERVVEVVMDEKQRWRFLRFRDDKDEANHISTVRSVMDSIRDAVSEKDLLDAAKGIKDSWKSRQAREKEGHQGSQSGPPAAPPQGPPRR